MNITNAQYYVNHMNNSNDGIKVTINGIKVSVPLDPANADYAEILRQVEAGELTIEDAD